MPGSLGAPGAGLTESALGLGESGAGLVGSLGALGLSAGWFGGSWMPGSTFSCGFISVFGRGAVRAAGADGSAWAPGASWAVRIREAARIPSMGIQRLPEGGVPILGEGR